MPDQPNFFSPASMDEHLERPSCDPAHMDRDLLLVHDLRAVYDAEERENRHSLQRVWERLAAEQTHRQSGTFHTESQLYALKPREEHAPVTRKARRKRVASPALTALAALLFLTLMVGSLLIIVHVTRTSLGASPPVRSTLPPQSTPTPASNYPYPSPGNTFSISRPSPAGFSGLTWSQDSQQVAASTQGKVWIWGAQSNAQPFVFDPRAGRGPIVLAWSPGAPLLAVGTKEVQIIDPGNGIVKFTDPALVSDLAGSGAARVTALAWSPDGTRLAVAGHDPVAGNAVSIWDVHGNLVYTFTGQRVGDAINSISWSSDGRYVASANGQSVQAWDTRIANGTPIFQHAIDAVTDVAWSPSANNAGDLAFVSNGSTQVWYVWNSPPVGGLVSNYPDTPNGSLNWSPDGHYLATASGRNVIIYNATTGTHLYTYSGNIHDVHALAWSPDGNYLASGENDPSGEDVVRVWSA